MSSLLDILVLAQEVQGEVEPTKTPFYIAGGLLAAWAVVVSILGVTQHDFPRSKGAARGVMGISALLMVGAMAATIATN